MLVQDVMESVSVDDRNRMTGRVVDFVCDWNGREGVYLKSRRISHPYEHRIKRPCRAATIAYSVYIQRQMLTCPRCAPIIILYSR